MSFGLSELIKKIGNENMSFQMLHNCMTNIRQAKKHSTISFQTEMLTATDVAKGTGKVGLIIWVDTDIFDNSLKELKENDK